MADFLGQLAVGLKRLTTIKKEMDDIQFKENILELKELLLTAKEEILGMREENVNLKTTIRENARAQERARNLIEVEGFKFDSADGSPIGLPYCPNCEVKEEGKLYRLKRANDYYSDCPNCKTSFQVGKDGRVHIEQQIRRRNPKDGYY
ncbi:MAG: hypothetical protein K0B00_12730 [Rhodobacteraceae bacterium]|nr:hypothetical protein [Paracoccaceae bacterium]